MKVSKNFSMANSFGKNSQAFTFITNTLAEMALFYR